MQRLDIGQSADPMLVEPGKKRTRSPVIGHPGIIAVDRGGEEFQESARRAIASIPRSSPAPRPRSAVSMS
jgi:hypothetical protein